MSRPTLSIPWGKEKIDLVLPESWQVTGVLEPAFLSPVESVEEEVRRSLAEPVGMGRLRDIATPQAKIALVIDDASRPTPVGEILQGVMAELALAGVRHDQISLVAAIGVHRGMDEKEIAHRAGEELLKEIRWENPDCDDLAKMKMLGTTSRGTPVWINKTVADADLIVSVGCIDPHIIASFGGGYKNILPGVAGRETIAKNHALNCQPSTFNNVGKSIDANPMRLDLEEGSQMLPGKVFIVNAVMNYRQEVVQIVAGDAIAAHRAGAKTSAQIYGVKIPKTTDVVITASHPMDIDLRQGVKSIANTIRAVKPGGVLISFIRAFEGTGVFGLANRKLPLGKKALKALAPVLLPLVPRLKLKGMGEEDRFFLYFALQAMRHATLLSYAPTIPAEIKERLPFVNFTAEAQETVEKARVKYPHRADVVVIPYGGITYPEIG